MKLRFLGSEVTSSNEGELHTKSDRLDSAILARLPLLHPDGLHPEHGLGPGEALRRATKLHSTLIHRRTTVLARLDALLEILGPA